ncbi:type IV pilus modification protein PilV [Bermanella marisrubri]|uniref:Type IV pilin Tt1218-like domain-containing protein n=1 Tax=Bermanella marisrubri TaxID=207949 RepID=Q1MYR7_9GAMM|nr:type IV pilus modification protein PilV [Bermanella marisrubri]EAT11139.1 hypothetical protein RED65_05074 [Oceanobacter sp. RED65] [Bermanella marisrubri]QIZ83462.1 type IV pilus modification protein PilV [Bermanella marisrubri]
MVFNIKKQSGFAMVEVLVTAVVVAIGISGMGVLLLKSLQGTQDNAQRSQAMWIVQDFVGRIRANSVGARAGYYVVNAQPDCTVEPAKMCADHRDEDDNLVQGAVCDPENYTTNDGDEMAIYDKWITACGTNDDIYTSPADFMGNPQLISRCIETSSRISTPTGNQDCVKYQIDFTWDTRIKQSGANAEDRVYSNSYSEVVEVN